MDKRGIGNVDALKLIGHGKSSPGVQQSEGHRGKLFFIVIDCSSSLSKEYEKLIKDIAKNPNESQGCSRKKD